MPKGIYEHKHQVWNKGKHFSQESREKMSTTRKRLIAEGKIPVTNKGRQLTQEHIQKRRNTIKRLYAEGKLKSWNDHCLNHEEVLKLFNLGMKVSKIAKHFNCEHKVIRRILKKHSLMALPTWSKQGELIKDLYVNENKSSKEIAQFLNLNMSSVIYTLKKMNVKMRTGAPKRGQFALDKNPNWQNGLSFEPYSLEFNNQFKNQIRQRDNQICMNCGIHREKLKEALHIHHVNYDKNCNIEQNFISLCRICHIVTNNNREYWTQLFQGKLSRLYGYKYQDGKVIIQLNSKQEVNNGI